MKLGIASDHRGYKLKEQLKELLNYPVLDFGTDSETSTDYPDYAEALCHAIMDKQVDMGIAICGSGIGISIACNKVNGIRCAKVSNIEEVVATRNDNDANVIAFGEKMPLEKAVQLIETFVETPCSMEEKHVRRRNKLTIIEDTN